MAAHRTILFAALGGLALSLSMPAGAQVYSEGYEFLKAIEEGDGNTVTEMLRKPGTTVINARDITSGESAMHLVTRQRNVTWIRFLSQEGANPNISDKNGVTPLMLATQLGFVEGVEALIEAGARVDVSNDAGETPLITAVHNRDLQLMEVFLKAGADPDRTDNSGRSARAYATLRSNDPRILSTLEEHETKSEDGSDAGAVYGPAF